VLDGVWLLGSLALLILGSVHLYQFARLRWWSVGAWACAVAANMYAPWPNSWHSHLPRQFAATLRDVCRFLAAALIQDPDPAAGGHGWQLRRKAYRALGDLHGEYQRAMSEPAAVSRRALAWWPAIVALDEVADAATATGVAIRRGAPAPAPDAVHQLTAALYALADAIDASIPARVGELPDDEALKPVTDVARPVLSVPGYGLAARGGAEFLASQ